MNPKRLRIAFLAFLLTSLSLAAAAKVRTTAAPDPPDITVDHPTLTMTVGDVAKVTITSTEPIASKLEVVWSDLGGIVDEPVTEVSGNTAVSTLKLLKFSPTPKEIKVKVGTSEPKTVTITTQTVVKAGDFPAVPGATPTIKQDERVSIPLNNLVGVNVTDEGLEVASADESVVLAVRRGTSILITGVKPSTSPVRVTVKSNGQVIKTYDVTVTEALDRVETAAPSIDLTENQPPYALSNLHVKVIGKSNGDLTALNDFKPRFSSTNPEMAEVDAAGTTLTAKRAPRGNEEPPKLIIQPGDNTARAISIPIRINTAPSKLNLTAQGRTIFVGRSDTFTTEVLDSQGVRIDTAQVDWTIPDAADQNALTITNSRGTQVTVQGLAPKEAVRLVGTLRSPAPTTPVDPVQLILNVKTANVSGFAPLGIRVDLLDSQTARDLFGRKAADEFYIAKIRLFNKLKNQNGEFGDSILVYSESLEIRVQLEMTDKGKSQWLALPQAGAVSYESLFGKPSTFPDLPGDPKCHEEPQPNFVAHYRPYTFDIVANTHDRRDARSTRTRILTLANGLSTFASFVTTVAVPPAGNDTRLGLDQFKGLLVPSFEKLFPSLKEVQRQNIISMVMRPLEEIPFGSDVTRILFIPKGKLYGMIPGKVFRIGGVSTTGACAEVGIVKKAGSVNQ